MTPEQVAIRRATRHAHLVLTRLDAAGMRELRRAYGDAAADIRAAIAQAAGVEDRVSIANLRTLLEQVESRMTALQGLRNGLLNDGLDAAARYGAMAAEGAAISGPGATVATAAAMRVSESAVRFVQAFIADDGLQLSDRLWRIDRGARDAVSTAIERAVIQGQSAAEAARTFLARGEPVPADLASKAAGTSSAAIGREATLAMTGQGGAADNAMRVFRTEINRAHGEAYMSGAEDKPFFGGWRYLLSPQHPEHDICDLLAEQNLYGLGNGVYPSRAQTPWPAHPNTLSFIEMVFKDEITEADRAGKETPLQALARLSPDVRRGVLGKTKSEMFDAGRLTPMMITARVRDVVSADGVIRRRSRR